jgi:diacylglycerol kinase family enzyme
MRAAAILGLGCSAKDLKPFQSETSVEWITGVPVSDEEANVILLFGGDGTVHRHLGQLVRLGLPVLVVPAGSGNDFACSLGLRRLRDSLEAWRKFCDAADNVRTIDLGVVSAIENGATASTQTQYKAAIRGPKYFCCVAGVGLDGEVARRANRQPRWLRGHGGYVLSLAPAIFSFSPLHMKILTPVESQGTGKDDSAAWNTRSDQPTLLATFANTPLYGGGMKIAPRAQMDDGLLDVCIVGAVPPLRLLRLFPSVYGGHHLNIREVDYFQSARARVETKQPVDVYADGEYVCRTPIEVAVHRAALKVVTP